MNLRYLILTLFIGSFGLEYSYAQVAANVLHNPIDRIKFQMDEAIQKANYPSGNQLLIDVNGMYNVEADSYLAIFHLTQVGGSAKEADSLMNKRISAFRKDALAAGVKEDDFLTDMLSMIPVYDLEITKKLFSKHYNEIPAGFEIQKNIHVRYYKAQVLDKIITAAAFQEIYDLVKVEYFVNDVDKIYSELHKQANALLEKRIKEYDSIGIAVSGTWRLVSDLQKAHYPIQRYNSYTSATRPSMQAVKKKELLLAESPKQTLFYNMLSPADFDYVIDPSIVGPVVQYTYNLQLMITLEKKIEKAPEPIVKTEIKNKYYFITTDGQVKELPTN